MDFVAYRQQNFYISELLDPSLVIAANGEPLKVSLHAGLHMTDGEDVIRKNLQTMRTIQVLHVKAPTYWNMIAKEFRLRFSLTISLK